MNTISTYLKIFTLLLIFSSCKRELSQEAQPIIPVDNTSQWSFEDSAGKRQGSVDTAFIASQGDIQALFLEGKTADGNEKIFLQVIGQPLTGGTYSNDQVSFAYYINDQQVYFNDPSMGEFTITITKLDTARVEGVFQGMVVNPATGMASIRNGTFKSRLFSVPVGGTSEGAIECDGITTGGQFEAGQETNATHYVEMTVNVTKPGTFQISSNLVNGIIFAGEGEFPAAGTYTLQIGAAGTPGETGISEFTISYGGVSCNFEVNVGGVADSLVEPPAGKLKAEEKVSGGAVRDEFLYYAGNSLIGQINSTVNPHRRIKYSAQDKINAIEIWNADGLGGYSLGSIAKFNYNTNGNVSSIVRTDEDGNVQDTMKTFYYNSSNQVIQKVHFQGGVPVERTVYEYTSGNVTKISWTDASLNNFVGNYQFTYDTRANKFKDLHPQFYYISMTNLYNATRYSEALYFSSNYPVTFTREDGVQVPFEVLVNPSLLPIETKANGVTEFRWEF